MKFTLYSLLAGVALAFASQDVAFVEEQEPRDLAGYSYGDDYGYGSSSYGGKGGKGGSSYGYGTDSYGGKGGKGGDSYGYGTDSYGYGGKGGKGG
eukprot:CAMPEP_0197261640 /NCGR_PEP_ID=MMETSP1432-20130617/77_1 /TAXON_ID=44447 /ORGANISM="Pseudo-nitzschia delicatissima, Strain UNC1205" /LENGTH=94 /DNA_ID=CAMNT_0042725921 /DNA_START=93 /DNA_END=373 /DNA_ORIENTATION=+